MKPELLRAIVDSGFEHPSEGKFFDQFLVNWAFSYKIVVSVTLEPGFFPFFLIFCSVIFCQFIENKQFNVLRIKYCY